MPAPPRARRLLLGAAFVLAACNPFDPNPWGEPEPRERPANPCFDVNLLDGLSETDPAEFRALYECLNAGGGFDAAEGVVRALESETTRAGSLAVLELGAVVNHVPAQVDVVSFVREAGRLLREENEFLVHVVHTLAEWTYGVPWPEVEAVYRDEAGGRFLEPSAVEVGLMQPLVPVLESLSRAVLDGGDQEQIGPAIRELTAMPQLVEALVTWASLVDEVEPELFSHFPEDFGAYFAASVARDGTDTLVALARAILEPSASLGGRTPAGALVPQVDALLDDPVLVDRLVASAGFLYEERSLLVAPGQLAELLAIDAEGRQLAAGERSAFEALFRLLVLADGPVDCGLIEVDNLAVEILERIARFEPGTVQSLILAMRGLIDWMEPLLVPAGWICDGVDRELAEHAPSLIRLAEVGVLDTLLPLLAAFEGEGQAPSRVPELVELIVTVEGSGVLPPVVAHGELVLDQPFIGNALHIVGAYVSPRDPGRGGDIFALIEVADFLISPRGAGYPSSLLGLYEQPFARTLDEQGEVLSVWLQRWALLLSAEGSESNAFAYHVAPLLAVDPDLETIAGFGRVVADRRAWEPLLRIMETPGVARALESSVAPDGGEGLLGLGGRFAADESLEALLSLLVWGADTLDSIGLVPDGPATDDDDSAD